MTTVGPSDVTVRHRRGGCRVRARFETWEQGFLDGGFEIYDQFADAWDEMYPDQKLPEEPNARGDASYNLLEPFESEERGLLTYWRLPLVRAGGPAR